MVAMLGDGLAAAGFQGSPSAERPSTERPQFGNAAEALLNYLFLRINGGDCRDRQYAIL